MNNKEIDDMFFKIYGQDELADEYKEMARNSKAYAGFKIYIRLEELMSKVLGSIENKIKEIINVLTK